MKFAIIAAGEGSRLSSEGIALPKPLVQVCGEHLLDRLIRIFASHNADEIVVICNEQAVAVQEHLLSLEKDGLDGIHLPLRHIVKTTPSSMHSFAELARLFDDEPFVLTTVDTIFSEKDFDSYLRCFSSAISNGLADGVMGVTSYIDDEKPLYIRTADDIATPSEEVAMHRITAFLDSDEAHECSVISGGIYGLTAPALKVLKDCMERGVSRMRNFQRALIEDRQVILAYPFGKILDIDHASDIEKAERFLTQRKSITAIYRAERFSPNNVENDRMILRMIISRYEETGFDIKEITEEELIKCGSLPQCDLILTMTRSKEALEIINKALHNGIATRCINTPEGISACSDRSLLNRIMQENGVETPPEHSTDGIWLKRTKGYSECKNDVVFCKTEEEISAAMDSFRSRGIMDVTRQAHIQGDLVKFYGISDTGFFHLTYPNDTSRSKFGVEQINGMPQHYPFSHSALHDSMNRVANAIGVSVYGGDAVIRADGSFVVIDFNDWPSFSACREEAGKRWIIDN